MWRNGGDGGPIDWASQQSWVHYRAASHGWVAQLNRCSWQQHKVYTKTSDSENSSFCWHNNVSTVCRKKQWQMPCFCSSCGWQADLHAGRGTFVYSLLNEHKAKCEGDFGISGYAWKIFYVLISNSICMLCNESVNKVHAELLLFFVLLKF